MHIRKAEKRDINKMADLLAALFLIETDFNVDRNKQLAGLNMLLDNPDKGIVFVAECEGKVIAMCALHYLISTAQGGMVGLIEDMIVEQGLRGKGIGRQLFEYVIKYANSIGISRIQLLTDKDNIKALNFYRKIGLAKTKLIALRVMI